MRHKILIGGITMAAVLLTSCANQVPGEKQVFASLKVMVDAAEPENIVLGEIYRQALAKEGIAADLVLTPAASAADRLEWLDSGQADLIAGCTGELLEALNPRQAKQLSGELGQGNSFGEQDSVSTYEAMISAFPATMDVADWSPAQGCQSDGVLAHNVVPVYRKEAVGRAGKEGLNKVNRYLTTQTLAELSEGYRKDPEQLATAVAEQFQVVR